MEMHQKKKFRMWKILPNYDLTKKLQANKSSDRIAEEKSYEIYQPIAMYKLYLDPDVNKTDVDWDVNFKTGLWNLTLTGYDRKELLLF